MPDIKRRRFLELAAISGLSASALVGCARKSISLRYRLSIVVNIAGRLREGSSVIEVEFDDWGKGGFPNNTRFVTRPWGEAVVIDLEDRGLLFGLLSAPSEMGGFSISQSLGVLGRLNPMIDEVDQDHLLEAVEGVQGILKLPDDNLPSLVRFKDTRDPRSVELVVPRGFWAAYGRDSSFVKATIEITGDARTTGLLDQRLPWLADINGTLAGRRHGRGPMHQRSLPERLQLRNFKRYGD